MSKKIKYPIETPNKIIHIRVSVKVNGGWRMAILNANGTTTLSAIYKVYKSKKICDSVCKSNNDHFLLNAKFIKDIKNQTGYVEEKEEKS